MNSKNPFALLGLSPGASVADIKHAYKQMALRWHPDKQLKDVDKEHALSVFSEINSAYQTLLTDFERPLTTVGAKLRTRFPTPMPSYKSMSEDSPTSASTTNSSHFFSSYNSNSGSSEITLPSSCSGSFKARHDYDVPAGNEYVSSQTTSNRRLHNDRWKPAIVPEARQSPHFPTESVHNNFRVYNGAKNVPAPWACITIPIENSRVLTPGPPLQPLGNIGRFGEWTYSLPLMLEDLFKGKNCQFCLVRHYLSGRSKNVIIEVDIPSGCRSGARILCRGVGNELPHGALQDVIFVVEEVPHSHFSRIEDDLYLDVNLPWTDSLVQRPEKVKIKGIDGKEISFSIDYVRRKMLNGENCVGGAGMPIRDGGRAVGRGDLIIRWEIRPPPTRIRHFLDRFLHPRTKR